MKKTELQSLALRIFQDVASEADKKQWQRYTDASRHLAEMERKLKTRPLRHDNCRIPIDRQIERYAQWLADTGRKRALVWEGAHTTSTVTGKLEQECDRLGFQVDFFTVKPGKDYHFINSEA